jgi:hypothetical protein
MHTLEKKVYLNLVFQLKNVGKKGNKPKSKQNGQINKNNIKKSRQGHVLVVSHLTLYLEAIPPKGSTTSR